MSATQTTEVKPAVQNGNGQSPAGPPPSDPPAQRPVKPTILARFFETVAGALLAGCVVVVGLNLESWSKLLGLVFILILGSVGAYLIAIRLAEDAATEEQAIRANRKYRVTIPSLDVLQERGVSSSVIKALSFSLGVPALPEDAFFDTVATRADFPRDLIIHFRETILTYTEERNGPASQASKLRG